MRKSYKFRIYPTEKQEITLIQTLTTCRHLYNDALAERRDQSKLNKLVSNMQLFQWGKPKWTNYYDQQRDIGRSKTEFQKSLYAHILQNVLRRVERSFKNFFNGFGYPRFQGRNRYNSFTFPDPYGKGYKITNDGKLKLSKIGEIKIKLHREIEGQVKTCTIKRDGNLWYAFFSVVMEPEPPLKPTGKSIGIDVGLKSLVTLSNGEQVAPPQYLRQSEEKMVRAQRSLSRKKKGSSNRNKQRVKVAGIHRKIRNQRSDFAHKLSRTLVNTYDTIVFEKLQIKNMVKNHHLAKSISDAGWGQLIQFTQYKAEYAGRVVELVDPKNTTQNCSSCGTKVPKSLSVRTHNCPHCGLIMDRDHNAAINILKRVRQGMPDLTPVEMVA